MAFSYVIDHDRHAAIVTFSGDISSAEIVETLFTVVHDPGWQFGLDILWDCRAITKLLFDVDEMRRFLELQHDLADIAGPGRDAILVGTAKVWMMAKIYVVMARNGPRQMHVCKAEEDAWTFLSGRNGPSDPPLQPRNKRA